VADVLSLLFQKILWTSWCSYFRWAFWFNV